MNSEFEPQPFDFLIDGELVRMSLEQFLLAKGISAVCTYKMCMRCSSFLLLLFVCDVMLICFVGLWIIGKGT